MKIFLTSLLFAVLVFAMPTTAAAAAAAPNGELMKESIAPVEVPGGVLFSFDMKQAVSIAVAGTFNGWDMKKNVMQKNKNGIWFAVISLPKGKIEYKIVINEKDWVDDPKNAEKIEDSYGGGKKSLFEVKTGIDLGGVAVNGQEVTFKFRSADAKSVSVAGSFNNWDMKANALVKGDDSMWIITIKFAAGKYQYKYVVDGSQWVVDPVNTASAEDGFGGSNSVVEVK